MIITSVSNNKIKETCKLKDKKYRNSTDSFLIEGKNLIEEAYKKNLLKEIFVLEDNNITLDVPTNYVSKEVMKKLSTTDSIPVVVGVSHKKREEELGNRLLILDNIQDPGNLGTIIRSAVAFNFSTIIVSEDTVDFYNDKVIRSSEGMIFNINLVKDDLLSIIPVLKEKGYKIYGTDVKKGKNIKTIDNKECAIIIGSEGKGISIEVKELCDDFIYINMSKTCESLNAAVASSIIMYEVFNR